MNEKAGKYAGMDRYECRKALVEDLKEQGLLVKVVPHSHNVGVLSLIHIYNTASYPASAFFRKKPPKIPIAMTMTTFFNCFQSPCCLLYTSDVYKRQL